MPLYYPQSMLEIIRIYEAQLKELSGFVSSQECRNEIGEVRQTEAKDALAIYLKQLNEILDSKLAIPLGLDTVLRVPGVIKDVKGILNQLTPPSLPSLPGKLAVKWQNIEKTLLLNVLKSPLFSSEQKEKKVEVTITTQDLIDKAQFLLEDKKKIGQSKYPEGLPLSKEEEILLNLAIQYVKDPKNTTKSLEELADRLSKEFFKSDKNKQKQAKKIKKKLDELFSYEPLDSYILGKAETFKKIFSKLPAKAEIPPKINKALYGFTEIRMLSPLKGNNEKIRAARNKVRDELKIPKGCIYLQEVITDADCPQYIAYWMQRDASKEGWPKRIMSCTLSAFDLMELELPLENCSSKDISLIRKIITRYRIEDARKDTDRDLNLSKATELSFARRVRDYISDSEEYSDFKGSSYSLQNKGKVETRGLGSIMGKTNITLGELYGATGSNVGRAYDDACRWLAILKSIEPDPAKACDKIIKNKLNELGISDPDEQQYYADNLYDENGYPLNALIKYKEMLEILIKKAQEKYPEQCPVPEKPEQKPSSSLDAAAPPPEQPGKLELLLVAAEADNKPAEQFGPEEFAQLSPLVGGVAPPVPVAAPVAEPQQPQQQQVQQPEQPQQEQKDADEEKQESIQQAAKAPVQPQQPPVEAKRKGLDAFGELISLIDTAANLHFSDFKGRKEIEDKLIRKAGEIDIDFARELFKVTTGVRFTLFLENNRERLKAAVRQKQEEVEFKEFSKNFLHLEGQFNRFADTLGNEIEQLSRGIEVKIPSTETINQSRDASALLRFKEQTQEIATELGSDLKKISQAEKEIEKLRESCKTQQRAYKLSTNGRIKEKISSLDTSIQEASSQIKRVQLNKKKEQEIVTSTLQNIDKRLESLEKEKIAARMAQFKLGLQGDVGPTNQSLTEKLIELERVCGGIKDIDSMDLKSLAAFKSPSLDVKGFPGLEGVIKQKQSEITEIQSEYKKLTQGKTDNSGLGARIKESADYIERVNQRIKRFHELSEKAHKINKRVALLQENIQDLNGRIAKARPSLNKIFDFYLSEYKKIIERENIGLMDLPSLKLLQKSFDEERLLIVNKVQQNKSTIEQIEKDYRRLFPAQKAGSSSLLEDEIQSLVEMMKQIKNKATEFQELVSQKSKEISDRIAILEEAEHLKKTKDTIYGVIEEYKRTLSRTNLYGRERADKLKRRIDACENIDSLNEEIAEFIKTGKTAIDENDRWHKYFYFFRSRSGTGKGSLRGKIIDSLDEKTLTQGQKIRDILKEKEIDENQIKEVVSKRFGR